MVPPETTVNVTPAGTATVPVKVPLTVTLSPHWVDASTFTPATLAPPPSPTNRPVDTPSNGATNDAPPDHVSVPARAVTRPSFSRTTPLEAETVAQLSTVAPGAL